MSRRAPDESRETTESEAARKVKAMYDNECQVCGQTLVVHGGKYAEATYVRPLGVQHHGTDSVDNILCLCPNHRVMFVSGTFTIGNDFGLIGVRLYRRIRVHHRHNLSEGNLRYHREHILEK